MQIVINLEEEIYEDIKYRYDKNQLRLGAMVLELAILHGEILPKGHGDLIDRNAIRQAIEDEIIDTSDLHEGNLIEAAGFNEGIGKGLKDIDAEKAIISADAEI